MAHERDRRTTLAVITERGREVAEQATRELNDTRFGTAPLARSELRRALTSSARPLVDHDDDAVVADSA